MKNEFSFFFLDVVEIRRKKQEEADFEDFRIRRLMFQLKKMKFQEAFYVAHQVFDKMSKPVFLLLQLYFSR